MQVTLDQNERADSQLGCHQLTLLGPTRQNHEVGRHRQLERQEIAVPGKPPLDLERDLAQPEAHPLDRSAKLGRVEARALQRLDSGTTLLGIDLYVTDALQASQGSLGPACSKWSRHAVDAKVGLLNLSERRASTQKSGKGHPGHQAAPRLR
jgi:hypothetical protein